MTTIAVINAEIQRQEQELKKLREELAAHALQQEREEIH